MKLDLIDIFNENKKLDKKRDELKLKKELMYFLSQIVKGEEEILTNNKKLISKIGLKYEKNKDRIFYPYSFNNPRLKCDYKIKVTKSNVSLIQKYLNNIKEEK